MEFAGSSSGSAAFWPSGNSRIRTLYSATYFHNNLSRLYCTLLTLFVLIVNEKLKMSLYDDLDNRQPSEQIDGWSSGIKLLQQQLVAKKTSAAANTGE